MPFEPTNVLPNEEFIEAIGTEESNLPIEPSDTWEFDFDAGEFTSRKLTGMRAYKQAMIKSINTERDVYEVYGDEYGSELHLLISDQIGTTEYKCTVAEDFVYDATFYDDRTQSVDGIAVTAMTDKMFIDVKLTADSRLEGVNELNLEVSINELH